MIKLIALLMNILPKLPSRKTQEEAYLHDAVDIYDLERRMQQMNTRAGSFASQRWLAGMEGR